MLILEFNQYDKYFSDNDFIKFFYTLKSNISRLYPQNNPNLELIIDRIYSFYKEDYLIDDLINKLYFDGHILQFKNLE